MPFLAARAPKTPADWLVLGGIFGFILLVALVNVLHHRRRRRLLAAAARELGLESVDLKSPDAAYVHQPIAGQKSFKLRVCAVAILADRAARFCEFTYITGSGKSTRTHFNTQLSLECPEHWPELILTGSVDFMHRPVGEFFKSKPGATDDAAFDKRWKTFGPASAETARRLGPEIRALLLQGDKSEIWCIKDGWLTCTRRKVGTAKDLPPLVERTQQVRTRLAAEFGD